MEQGVFHNNTPPLPTHHVSEGEIILKNVIVLSQKRIGVGSFGHTISVIVFFFLGKRGSMQFLTRIAPYYQLFFRLFFGDNKKKL